jgi:hypothetical protein
MADFVANWISLLTPSSSVVSIDFFTLAAVILTVFGLLNVLLSEVPKVCHVVIVVVVVVVS